MPARAPRRRAHPRNGNSLGRRPVDAISSLAVADDFFGLFSESSSTDAPKPPASNVRPVPAKRVPMTTTKPTDRELVDLARNGDANAFGQLVRRHQQRIQRLAVHMLRDRAEAEDVTQETFIRAYQALSRFDGRSEPYTWFYRITINLSLNRIRSRKTSRATHDTEDPRLEGLLTDKRPESADPANSAQRQELYRHLCSGIAQLSETLRTTLILVCIDGRSHDAVAGILR